MREEVILLKKRIFSLTVLFVLLFSVTAQAVQLRTIRSTPSLTFSGTTAICSADCKSGNANDYFSVTLTLWQGNTYVSSWSASGSGRVLIFRQCAVIAAAATEASLTA